MTHDGTRCLIAEAKHEVACETAGAQAAAKGGAAARARAGAGGAAVAPPSCIIPFTYAFSFSRRTFKGKSDCKLMLSHPNHTAVRRKSLHWIQKYPREYWWRA